MNLDLENWLPLSSEPRSALGVTLVALVVGLVGCGRQPTGETAPSPAPPQPPIRLVDATVAAGLDATHTSGATAERYLPETMGAGVAVFDADGDDRADIYLVGGLPVAHLGDPTALGNATLYLATGDGTFVDTTDGSGLEGPHLGMGAAVGDLDNDGDLDLLVTGVGGDRLFENRSEPGSPRFVDITLDAGLDRSPAAGEDPAFSSSAAFLDADRDGRLDLFVGRYVAWSRAGDLPCRPDGRHRSYCTPEAYPGVASRFYRNLGDRRFADVTAEVGLGLDGKTLGVAVVDLDDDLWPDLVVANDTARNFLYRNRGDGRFEEVGIELGIAVGQSGAPRGAMGIDAGDLDGDGAPELVIGNFAQEMSAVYRLGEGGIFVDQAAHWGVGLETLMPLAFGVQALDLDLDGGLDLVFVHGHIEPEIERFQPLQRHAQPLLIFHNRLAAGYGLRQLPADAVRVEPLVGRGLASGDLDGDGDLDLVITQNGGPARLLRNDSPTGHFLRLRLEGTRSNRTGYGARVAVEVAGRVLHRDLVSGRSYLSASEPVLTIGLGDADRVDAVTVRWPSGQVQALDSLAVDRLHVIVEPDAR